MRALHTADLSERGFRRATYKLVYEAVILIILLCCETWIAYRRHMKVLEQFEQRIPRLILGVHLQDQITNSRIPEQADTICVEAHIARSQLSWAGHNIMWRMPDTRVTDYTSTVGTYAKFSSGKRKKGTVKTLQRPTERQPEEV